MSNQLLSEFLADGIAELAALQPADLKDESGNYYTGFASTTAPISAEMMAEGYDPKSFKTWQSVKRDLRGKIFVDRETVQLSGVDYQIHEITAPGPYTKLLLRRAN